MSFWRSKKTRGTVVVILLGLVSVMLVFAFAVSKRVTSQSQLITISDSTQIARFFLESYAGDILYKIKKAINDPSSRVYEAIRNNEEIKSEWFYKEPSETFKKLIDNLNLKETFESDGNAPTITLSETVPLLYPKILNVPKTYSERKGSITIVCRTNFAGRKYKLSVAIPYKVTMALTPLLKDFVLFADQIGLEQNWANSADYKDNINVLFTKESDSPQATSLDPSANDFGGKPWILKNMDPDPMKNGNVFLGPDNRNICLNLAGESKPRYEFSYAAGTKSSNVDPGELSDLWLPNPKFFKPNPEKPFFNEDKGEMFGEECGLRGLILETKIPENDAFMYLFGFCQETREKATQQALGKSDRVLRDLLLKDPVFGNFYDKFPDFLCRSTPIKLFGENPEIDLKATIPQLQDPDIITALRQTRFIFGNVFARFILVSFFKMVSASGAITTIPYDGNPNAKLTEKFYKYDGTEVEFQPDGPYQKYMSRVVSGGHPDQDDKKSWVSMNRLTPPSSGGSVGSTKMNSCLKADEFLGLDGLAIKSGSAFNSFASEWVPNLTKDTKKDAFDKSLYARVSRYFPNPEAFLEYATAKRSDGAEQFRLGGVICVGCGDKGLQLPAITTPNVIGGTLICTGSILISEVTRGIPTKDLGKVAETIQKNPFPQSSFLTFVSLKPVLQKEDEALNARDSIVLWGNNFFGIQVVALSPREITPVQMLRFQPYSEKIPINFFGGLAISTPFMKGQVKTYVYGKTPPPFMQEPTYISYIPTMADQVPEKIVGLSSAVGEYDFVVE